MSSLDTSDIVSKLLIVEPFYSGSHKQLVDLLCDKFNAVKYTLPGKKWHWRARTSALYFSQTIPRSDSYQVLFASSVLNLAELTALRPDLSSLKKILYFHENQLIYPVRKQQERDFQYGYNQVLSCLVADTVLFNSMYNLDSFLNNIPTFMKLIPDHRPKGLPDIIRPKCQVLYFSLSFKSLNIGENKNVNPTGLSTSDKLEDNRQAEKKQGYGISNTERESGKISIAANNLGKKRKLYNQELQGSAEVYESEHAHDCSIVTTHTEEDTCKIQTDINYASESGKEQVQKDDNFLEYPTKSLLETSVVMDTDSSEKSNDFRPLHIVWAHRWEHDKDPDTFFKTLYRLKDDGLHFDVSVMGEMFTDVPEIFAEAKSKLCDHIMTWGYQVNKGDYSVILKRADVAVSTAIHEFFGVSMIEATRCGCYPLCPDRLVYPEIFPSCCLYRTPTQLYKRLREFCRRPHLARIQKPQVDLDRFCWESLHEEYERVLCLNEIKRC